MNITDRQIRRTNEQRVVKIDDVNMPKDHISMVDQFGTQLQAIIHFADPVTVIPRPGEHWIAERRGADWYLTKKATNNTLRVFAPGDVIVNGDLFSKSIQGIVNADGTTAGGSGFSIVKATGTYTITYDTAFLAAPLITLAKNDPVGYITIGTNSPTTTILKTYNTSSVLTDSGFHFTATRVG